MPEGSSRDGIAEAPRIWTPVSQCALAVVALVTAGGVAAPWLSATLIGLSPNEQHPALAFAAPGAEDVSHQFPAYDGDTAFFQRLDRDGDGSISCHLDREAVSSPGASAALQRRFAAETPGHRVPLPAVALAMVAPLRCPELEVFTGARRAWSLLIEAHDQNGDERLSIDEFPRSLAQLHPRLQAPDFVARAGAWPQFTFEELDADGDGSLTRIEITRGTLATRFDVEDLLTRFDRDGDLAIATKEFPGLPRLRVFWLGADGKGRDLLTRLLHGARVSLAVGLLATVVALLIGTIWGAIAGYVGGHWDMVMMRIVDLLYGLPFMFIVILLLVVAGRSTTNLFIALGAVSWLNMARITRGQVRSVRERDYVRAAVAIGASPARVLWRHVLPATIGPIVVTATLMVPAVIVEEAFLSFLGLGVQPPDSSWGTLIAEGAGLMANHPWLIAWPAATLGLTLLSLNFLGDGLRDYLDRAS